MAFKFSGGRFQAADFLSGRLLAADQAAEKKAAEKIGNLGGRKKKRRNFLKRVFKEHGIIQVFQNKIPVLRLYFPQKFRGSFSRNFQKTTLGGRKVPV